MEKQQPEGSNPTPSQPSASNVASPTFDIAGALPPRPKSTPSTSSGRKNRSEVWNYYTLDPKSDKNNKKAICNLCSSYIMCNNGTSAMHSHLKRCKDNPEREENKKQKTIPFMKVDAGDGGNNVVAGLNTSMPYLKFDQEVCRVELVKMFIDAELPFRFVENESFRQFLSVLQPRFVVPSRRSLARDISSWFDMEKFKLKKFLKKHCRRVCLTTDTWTSCQNMNYMCLTAHFIDNDWKLQKKILNFCQVTGHSAEVMAKSVEVCLNDWELNKVLSVTLDNASSNNLGIQYLRKRFLSWKGAILNGEYIHMRCCAHILNLIVREGLKEIDESIMRIRAAVKYFRSSPSRLTRFKTCAAQEKISFKGSLCLDVETRWNSTYMMLDASLKYKHAFDLLEMQDSKFVEEMRKENGKDVPSEEDWNQVRTILPFLKVFYDATLRISSTSSITSNGYMKEVFGLGKTINYYCESNNSSIKIMAGRMRKKYEKYWGAPDGINMLLLIAVVLDPRHKLDYVNWFIDYFFPMDRANELRAKLLTSLRLLYEQYLDSEGGSQSQSAQQDTHLNEEEGEEDDPYGVNLFLQSTGRNANTKSELEKYMKEDCEPYTRDSEFDILNWWKVNATRFPVLASIAREVLAIPVSTVASESAFSTGGRVLDPYRSSLTPKIVESLICTQDWLKYSPSPLLLEEDLVELEKFEQEESQQQNASSGVITLDE